METVTLPQEDPESTMAKPALAPALLDELAHLDSAEHDMLAEMLLRARRDRDANGPLDEIALIANDLKSHPETDDWLTFMKIGEKVAPDLQKTYPDAERFPLVPDLMPLDATFPDVLAHRASKRDYSGGLLSLEELSTLLAQAYGVKRTIFAYNRPDVPLRYVPSTGGLQCVEVYLVVNAVEGLAQGLYHYNAVAHCLERLEQGNFRWKLVEHCPQHDWLSEASVVLLLAPTISRISWKYARRSYRMAHIDTGIVSQTLHLVATALRLNSCLVMGYQDDPINAMLGLDGRTEFVILLMAVGRQSWEDGPLKADASQNATTGGDGHAGDDGYLSS